MDELRVMVRLATSRGSIRGANDAAQWRNRQWNGISNVERRQM